MFKEFPKALYLGGNAEDAHKIVKSAEHEAAARADGYASVGESVVDAQDKPKRGRKAAE